MENNTISILDLAFFSNGMKSTLIQNAQNQDDHQEGLISLLFVGCELASLEDQMDSEENYAEEWGEELAAHNKAYIAALKELYSYMQLHNLSYLSYTSDIEDEIWGKAKAEEANKTLYK